MGPPHEPVATIEAGQNIRANNFLVPHSPWIILRVDSFLGHSWMNVLVVISVLKTPVSRGDPYGAPRGGGEVEASSTEYLSEA